MRKPYTRRTPWHDRRIFNTWRRPWPYLLNRWEVHFPGEHQGLNGYFTRRGAQAWVDEYNNLPEEP